jgi:anhydro-N-acetylmuramic acid kinase
MDLVSRLNAIASKDEKTIIGIMSGMSMDGINLACVKISGEFPLLKIDRLGTHMRSYSQVTRQKILRGREATVAEVSELNFAIADEFSQSVKEYLEKHNLSANDIDLIGSHGQTLYHSSQSTRAPNTLQVGNPSLIAEKTGIPTIGNFRIRDMAAGGQGAPLVALADYIMHHQVGRLLAVNNLGSISNVTVVTPDIDDVLAFDTGPANMIIDYFASLVPGNRNGIDTDGEISAGGCVLPGLLSKLLALPFFEKQPPRAAGYEDFGPMNLESITEDYMDANPQDLVRTAVEFSAVTIAEAYQKYVIPKFPSLQEIRFSGGGIYNKTLMQRIRHHLPNLTVKLFDPEFSNATEAISFAILAHETICGRPGNVLGATGALKRVVLGEIAI